MMAFGKHEFSCDAVTQELRINNILYLFYLSVREDWPYITLSSKTCVIRSGGQEDQPTST